MDEQRMISPEIAQLKDEIVHYLAELESVIREVGDEEVARQVAQSRHFAGYPFSVVVVGEYNSGKSTVVNALLGEELLTMDVTPTTDRITLLCDEHFTVEQGNMAYPFEIKRFSHPLLAQMSIIDTPGTNSLMEIHQQVTEQFIPHADLILFVLSSLQPLTASERSVLQMILSTWGKTVLFLINKTDLLSTTERTRVKQYVEDQLRHQFHTDAPLYLISAKNRLASDNGEAKVNGDTSADDFHLLERYLLDTLTDQYKWHQKLSTPLKSGRTYLAQMVEKQAAELSRLKDEHHSAQRFQQLVDDWSEQSRKMIVGALTEVEPAFQMLKKLGVHFIEKKIAFNNLIDLVLHKGSFQDEFLKEVYQKSDFEAQFNDARDRVVSLYVDQLHGLRNMLMKLYQSHQDMFAGRTTNVTAPPWSEIEQKILRTKAQDDFRGSFDFEEEARLFKADIDSVIRNFLGLQASGGATLAVALSTAISDVSGISMAALLAGLGFAVIPRKRARAKVDFKKRVSDDANRIREIMREQFESEISLTLHGVKNTLAPYLLQLERAIERCSQVKNAMDDLVNRGQQIAERVRSIAP